MENGNLNFYQWCDRFHIDPDAPYSHVQYEKYKDSLENVNDET